MRALFEDADSPLPSLPYLLVDLDATEIIPHDGHPNAAGAMRLAEAVVTWARGR